MVKQWGEKAGFLPKRSEGAMKNSGKQRIRQLAYYPIGGRGYQTTIGRLGHKKLREILAAGKIDDATRWAIKQFLAATARAKKARKRR